jgi:signal peptidase
MPPGTLVVVRHTDPSSLVVGDVVTYQPTRGSAEVITHRVVAVGLDATGQPVFRTKGDANPAPDPVPVHGYQIVGARWYSVPYVGYLTRLLTGEERVLAVRMAIGALLLYAMAMFVADWHDRRPRRGPRPRRGGQHAHA